MYITKFLIMSDKQNKYIHTRITRVAAGNVNDGHVATGLSLGVVDLGDWSNTNCTWPFKVCFDDVHDQDRYHKDSCDPDHYGADPRAAGKNDIKTYTCYSNGD